MDISLKIGNARYTGWTGVSVTRVIGEMCGDFNFTLVDHPVDTTKNINSGDEVIVSLEKKTGSDRLITGYIYVTERTKDSNGTIYTFTGRDKTSDLVDSAALYKTSTWKQKDLSKIAIDICEPFDIDVFMFATDPQVKEFALQSGETAFAAIERLCRAYTILPLTDENGTLVLTSIGDSKADVVLEVGKNIISLVLQENNSERYSQYYARGQKRGGGQQWKNDYVSLVGSATDADIVRYRPMVIAAERHMTAGEIKKRAAWEAQVRAGRAIRAIVTVPGWYQNIDSPETSRPWTINELVSLVDLDWGINATLVIGSVTFEVSEAGGRVTKMELYPPEIYAANPSERIQLSRKSSVRPS